MLAALLLGVLLIPSMNPLPAADSLRTRIRFDDGWRFRREAEDPRAMGMGPFHWETKPASESSLELDALPADFEEGEWRPIRTGAQNLRQSGQFAWFRATIDPDPANAERLIRFTAVDDNCVVFVNGKKAILHRGWNDPFEIPLRAYWKPGGPNTIAMLVENTGGTGGIAGPVRLELPPSETTPPQAQPGFDDARWRQVHLPHDYVVEGEFQAAGDTGHGSLPNPPAWYRKRFNWPVAYRAKAVFLEFDGVFRNSTVWLNGTKLGTHPSGYIGVRYDVSKLLKPGSSNVIAVYVDPRQNEGWWYEGGGIYRHVWLNVLPNPVHVAPEGIFVASKPDERFSDPRAVADFSAELTNLASRPQEVEVRFAVTDPKGRSMAPVVKKATLPVGATIQVKSNLGWTNAYLWSPEQPSLYLLTTTVLAGGKPIDEVETTFGVRSVRFDPDQGFFLNGKPVKLKGTCNHQDFAGVGLAMPDGLLEWRIKKLKEMGSNAYRCSHNPPAAELLDACDRLGMLVMDETRHLADATASKTASGTPYDKLTELRSMVRRDRNHPSIILWCFANEEGLQGTEEGAAMFTAMKKATFELDPTRPTTAAMNGGHGQGFTQVMDVLGFNYSIGEYDRIRRDFPKLPLVGSETASALSTRGIYANDTAKGYVSAYDVNHPSWGHTAEVAWKAVAERPYIAGTFVWTGFDYRGEPTPYGWPCISSHFGIMDMCGFPKDTWWYYKAWWGNEPVVHLLPHWTWPGKAGQPIQVWCHSNADRVELFLNGKSLGAKEVPRNGHLEWEVLYAPGKLEAVGHFGSKEVRDVVETTGAPATIRLKPDRNALIADQEDLIPVEVAVLDAQGRVVPTASNRVEFALEGPGRIAGVGNGDPSDHDPNHANFRRAFNGRCMVLVQAGNKAGKLTLTATSPGLKAASLTFTAMKPKLAKGLKLGLP